MQVTSAMHSSDVVGFGMCAVMLVIWFAWSIGQAWHNALSC